MVYWMNVNIHRKCVFIAIRSLKDTMKMCIKLLPGGQDCIYQIIIWKEKKTQQKMINTTNEGG